MLLAIDTATRYLNLALFDGQDLIAEQGWRTANQHNRLLAPAIEQVLAICEIPMDDLTAIAVTTGPGSYTGLRIGISLAKGLASVRQLPLIGISTLDMLALGQSFQNTRYGLLTILQAGRGRISVGEYQVKKGRWEATKEPYNSTWDNLLATLDDSYYITGEVDESGKKAIEAAKEKQASLTLIEPANRIRRAGILAQEAWRRWQDHPTDDFSPAKLLPVYITTVDEAS